MAQFKHIMTSEEMSRAIARMTHEILEKNKGSEGLVLVGIRTGGAMLAKRFGEKLKAIQGKEIPIGLLDITMYRDDLSKMGAQPDMK